MGVQINRVLGLVGLLAAVAVCLLSGPPADAAKRKAVKKRTAVAANSGLPGARCKAVYRPGDGAPDVSTTLLGVTPAPYEVGEPTRKAPRGGERRRVMLLLHGGAWFTVGAGAMADQRSVAGSWRAAGWTTVNAGYRACKRSVDDVVAVYDRIREHFGPDVPVCVRGESAGGHLALLLAGLRSDVDCVIAAAAPTDLWSMVAQGRRAAADGSGPAALKRGVQWGFGVARSAFGRGWLTRRSPTTWAASLDARVLMGVAHDDPIVPFAQAEQLADALRAQDPGAYVDLHRLESGDSRWVHAKVSDAAAKEFGRREASLVAPFGDAPATPVKPKTGLPGLLDRILRPLRPR